MSAPRQLRPRNLVLRPDGKLVNVARKRGQLFVCATGCCCGIVERGFAPVPTDVYHAEWERRRLRNRVHLSIGGCLGPCPLANVVLLLFDGQEIWFHSMGSDELVLALYDYIDQMMSLDAYLPPPPPLAGLHFTSFDWAAPVRPVMEVPANDGEGILFLTHADTDLLALSAVVPRLPPDFPPLRAANLTSLMTDADVDALLDARLPGAALVIVRLHGGRQSFAHGLDRLISWAHSTGGWLLCLPGVEVLDPELMALSTVGVPDAHEVATYLRLGGPNNLEHCLRFLADHLLTTGFGYDPPELQPREGLYHPDLPVMKTGPWRLPGDRVRPTAAILFYRAHWLAGNTAFIDALLRELTQFGFDAIGVFAYSLKDDTSTDGHATPDQLPAALRLLIGPDGEPLVDVLISTMSFAMGAVNPDGPTSAGWSVAALERLGVPVLQAIPASISQAQWVGSTRGLGPLDTAMNVALPEFDGRIIGVPVSFKDILQSPDVNGTSVGLGSPVIAYVPQPDRVARVAGLAARQARLRRTPNREKRIAVVLTNAAAKAGRVGNAVGLDAPASLLRLLSAMRDADYVVGDLPSSGDALIQALLDRCSYDQEWLSETQLANAIRVPESAYASWFEAMPRRPKREMTARWGAPPGAAYLHAGGLALAGLEFGNVFVALQPPRGYGLDPNVIYHQPDLPPTHHFHAFYGWLRTPHAEGGWGADAIIHLGKHGTLEWLPGKGVGLSADCYPDALLADMPFVYPFIINNPGEGAQAKRRAHAVIVDHMTPPMMSAGAYGELAELARLVDEYYQVEALDPMKLPILQQQLWERLTAAKLDGDLALLIRKSHVDHSHEWDETLTEDGVPTTLTELGGKDVAHLLEDLDGYLCELTGAQIRDGLHVLGEVPIGEQLIGLLAALTRLPNLDVPSLRAAVASAYDLDLASLLDTPGRRLDTEPTTLAMVAGRPIVTAADALEIVDQEHRRLLGLLLADDNAPDDILEGVVHTPGSTAVAGSRLTSGVQPPEALPSGATGPTPHKMANFGHSRANGALLARWCHSPIAGAQSDLLHALDFVRDDLLPNLRRIPGEIDGVLAALAGRYVPAGPSGAPTRGMAHILPTGRNFYAVDPRGLPSQAAWRVGQALADDLLARHLTETGHYPERIGLSIWGTSAMRTHGDDIAQVFALLGVRPCWAPESRRLVGVEAIPLAELGRPRIDVVCRISGFFRDAFPHLIALLDDAVALVAGLDEPIEINFLRRRLLRDRQRLIDAGVPPDDAERRARYRVFGCKPGAYGAGILPLIDERNWQGLTDFAESYVNWGGFAYSTHEFGVDARDDFRQALATTTVAVKNQDNREHDIFDSDDYLQYHGGMIATIRALSGRQPRAYIGDSSDPSRVRVRDLREEARRVFRSRVINPAWIGSMQRHGYKGGLELAATVDYLFGYDATSDVMEDWMYERLTEAYLLDEATTNFLSRSNPWARREMAGRLLEAVERGLWERPEESTLAGLRGAYLAAETDLEGRSEP